MGKGKSSKRIVVIGNSVALKMRPKREIPGELTFSEYLLDEGHELYNVGRAGTTISEAFLSFDDDVIARYPDYLIIVYGIVEAYPRQTVRSLNNFNIRNYYNNFVFSRRFSPPHRRRALGGAVRLINSLMRRTASLMGRYWFWMSRRDFQAALEDICQLALSETNTNIILVCIPAISRRNSKYSIAAQSSITAFNEIMRSHAKFYDRISCIDITKGASDDELMVLCPDGIHFSAEGHKFLANQIILEIVSGRTS